MVKVSAIMSCYKSNPAVLTRTIQSILRQSFKNFEFLIRSDGLDFNLEYFLKRFNDTRIKFLHDSEHRGNSGGHNYLIDHATGDYVSIIDHDDEHLPFHFQKCVDELERDKSLFSVSGLTINTGNSAGRIIGAKMEPDIVTQKLIFYQPIRNPTAFMRRCTLEDKHLRYDTNFTKACDYEFWSRVRKLRHRILGDILVKYYRHTGSDSFDITTVKIAHRKVVKRNLLDMGIPASDKLVELISPYTCTKPENGIQYIKEFESYKNLFLKDISLSYYNQKLLYLKNRVGIGIGKSASGFF